MDELLDYWDTSYKPDPNKPIITAKVFKFKLNGKEYLFHEESEAKMFQKGFKDALAGSTTEAYGKSYMQGVEAYKEQYKL